MFDVHFLASRVGTIDLNSKIKNDNHDCYRELIKNMTILLTNANYLIILYSLNKMELNTQSLIRPENP